MTARGLIIAAPASGSGKTTITLALLAALTRRGIAVRAAKAGPDYIDPAFHAAATGAPSFNLDSWAMPPPLLDALAAEAARDAEILVIEGVMGLFDGVPGLPGRSGATADLAARFGLPVLLVLDVAAQAQTAAAVVRGFLVHDPAVRIAGVVLNRIGSERHRMLVADAIAALNVPVVGALPRDETLTLPERHLGLVQAGEHADLAARLDRLADLAERHLDLDAVIAGARTVDVADGGKRFTTASAAWPTHRARLRRGLLVRLSAHPRRMAASRRRDRAVLSARRRAAAARAATAAGCPAAIRSCTPERWRRRSVFAPGSRNSQSRARCTASAAATWCSAKGSRTPTASATP